MERERALRRQGKRAGLESRSPVMASPSPSPPPLPPPLKQGKRIPVVYYLCRNRHLEHPHFIEVPISSPEGLYLRDFVGRLNALRGEGMPAMYSWSCKRSYKNGFVWQDLSEDDLIYPSHGNEFVLKGSELLDHSSSGGNRSLHSESNGNLKLQSSMHPRTQEDSSSSSSPPQPTPAKETTPQSLAPAAAPAASATAASYASKGDDHSSVNASPAETESPAEYSISEPPPIDAHDAATQTDDGGEGEAKRKETGIGGVAAGEESSEVDADDRPHVHQTANKSKDNAAAIGGNEDDISLRPTASSSAESSSGDKTETLESLMRAEVRMNRFRVLQDEQQVLVSTRTRLKATDFLMQLITCGSTSVKDQSGLAPARAYKPRMFHMKFGSPMFDCSMLLSDLDCLSENPSLMKLRMEDKAYFSGSLIESKKHRRRRDGKEGAVPALKRSSSYDADRASCKPPNHRRDKDSSPRSKCPPRTTVKISSGKQPRVESGGLVSSKVGNGRITDASSAKGSYVGFESFGETKEKVIKIEKRLASGARVIIRSSVPLGDSD